MLMCCAFVASTYILYTRLNVARLFAPLTYDAIMISEKLAQLRLSKLQFIDLPSSIFLDCRLIWTVTV